MKKCLVAVLFAGFCLATGPAASGPYDNLTAPQLLSELNFNSEMLQKTDEALQENVAIAERNGREIDALKAELPQLQSRDADHVNRVNQHNAEVANYENQCTRSELDEGTYNWCLGWQSNLNAQKSRHDTDAATIQRAFDDYNRRADDVNRRERDRAWAAEQLVRKYDEYSANIQSIQLRLNALAAAQPLADFAEKNQQCAALENLEAMHQCMQSLWDGAEY